MIHSLLVGLGGFIGSMLRYFVNLLVYRFIDFPTFPYGTLIVNLAGCLAIGFLSGLAESREFFTPEIKLFVFIGILGGFTTFSSFGYDTFGLIRNGQIFLGSINVFIQIFFGLSAVWIGYYLSRVF